MMSNPLLFSEPRPKRSDALENYALLLDTAKRLIAERGIEHVSMSCLAEAAGVGKGTLYRHFPKGKVELLQTLLDADQRDLQARTFARLNQGGTPGEQLTWFVGEVYAFVVRNLPLMRLEAGSGVCSLIDHPAHMWWRMTIRGLLARAGADDPDYNADILYLMLDPRTIDFQRNTLGYDVDRITSGLLATATRLAQGR
jgi:AcrR family transcriptional regulator